MKEFCDTLYAAFQQEARIRRILEFYGLYEDRTTASLGENSLIVGRILGRAGRSAQTLEGVLNNFADASQALIFAAHMTVFNIFERGNANFISRWMTGAEPIGLVGFEGWYKWRDQKIPVFTCHMEEGKFLIVDRSKTREVNSIQSGGAR